MKVYKVIKESMVNTWKWNSQNDSFEDDKRNEAPSMFANPLESEVEDIYNRLKVQIFLEISVDKKSMSLFFMNVTPGEVIGKEGLHFGFSMDSILYTSTDFGKATQIYFNIRS